MTTNDHTVPESYLRRFGQQRPGKGTFIVARRADAPENRFEPNIRNIAAVKGFYWTTSPDGEPDHTMGHLLGRIETVAAPAFNVMLDDRDYALARHWPLRRHLRERLCWWMAAQMLRTTRQRSRLIHLLHGHVLDAPRAAAAT